MRSERDEVINEIWTNVVRQAHDCVVGVVLEELRAMRHLLRGTVAYNRDLSGARVPLGVAAFNAPACCGGDIAERACRTGLCNARRQPLRFASEDM